MASGGEGAAASAAAASGVASDSRAAGEGPSQETMAQAVQERWQRAQQQAAAVQQHAAAAAAEADDLQADHSGPIVLDNIHDPDFWDDSALVALYQRSISTYRSAADDPGDEDEDVVMTWHVGEDCAAPWSGDGLVYEAVIESMDRNEDRCVVRFKGYGNSEQLKLSNLLPPGSGINGEEEGEETAAEDAVAPEPQTAALPADTRPGHSRRPTNTSGSGQSWQAGDRAQYNGKEVEIESVEAGVGRGTVADRSGHSQRVRLDELRPVESSSTTGLDQALANMTMAWYMSGYHTGYYQALQDISPR